MTDLTQFAGFRVHLLPDALTLAFDSGVTSNPPTTRLMDEVRALLCDPGAAGPERLYTIYMDIRVPGIVERLRPLGLGYGAVVMNHGALGREALRTQGHVHATRPNGDAPSELYEFWHGRGLVYMQDVAGVDVSQAIAIEVGPGDKVAIPPGWAHATVNVGSTPMAFGAVYALDALLMYDPLKPLRGMAHYVLADGSLEANPRYPSVPPVRRMAPPDLAGVGVCAGRPALAGDIDGLDFVSRPERHRALWQRLVAGSDG